MKRLVLVGVLALWYGSIAAQETRWEKQREINELYKNKAVVERFDQSVIKSKAEKQRKQAAIEARRFQILSYLDTVSISEGARRKLRIDLDKNPFSSRFQKFMIRYKKEVLTIPDKVGIASKN